MWCIQNSVMVYKLFSECTEGVKVASQEIWVRSIWERKRENRGSPFIHKWHNSLKEVHFERFEKPLQISLFPKSWSKLAEMLFHLSFHFGEFGRINHFKFRRNTRSAQKKKKTSKEKTSLFDTWEFWKFKPEILSKWITPNTIISLNRKNRYVPRTHFWPWRALF